jgi:hypothetical protein
MKPLPSATKTVLPSDNPDPDLVPVRGGGYAPRDQIDPKTHWWKGETPPKSPLPTPAKKKTTKPKGPDVHF